MPLAAACVFVVAATSAATRETPTVDEFAHVPAGLLHWRSGELELYRNNPPLGKLWVAAPLAVDRSVTAPPYRGDGVGWEPWQYATAFEWANLDRYLSLMTRARLMTLPLVLAGAAIVYFWTRSLFGEFAAALSTTLFLLSPTILAHGHLGTVDVASMASIAAAVFALRWHVQRPGGRRAAIAGAALGLALAVKYSALYLVGVLPVLMVVLLWHEFAASRRLPALGGQLLVYAAAACLLVNLSVGFAGSFTRLGDLELRSVALRSAAERIPHWLPVPLPRAYVTGIDALKEDLEANHFPGYLLGEWSDEGWASYYPIAFAVKESELVVILTLVAAVTLPLALRAATSRLGRWRELTLLVAPPAVLLFIAAFLNSLCLGIRYVLPVFPFLFVMLGSSFAWLEARLTRRSRPEDRQARTMWADRRTWIALPIVAGAVLPVALVHPAYLSYFNRFAGGSRRGAEWLVDSNLDWGQDLYRLPAMARTLGVERWQLVYFGHVDPALYGISYQQPRSRPEPGVYAVSANYWKGMRYAHVSADGDANYVTGMDWLESLLPTGWAGSIAIFDLRESALRRDRFESQFNAGVLYLARREFDLAAAAFQAAAQRDPQSADCQYFLSQAHLQLGQTAEAVRALRRAIQLRGDWSAALNNLAWQLVASSDARFRNVAEGVRLAERACETSGRKNVDYLDTLALAYAAAGRRADAIRVCNEGLEQAERARRDGSVAGFRRLLAELDPARATASTEALGSAKDPHASMPTEGDR